MEIEYDFEGFEDKILIKFNPAYGVDENKEYSEDKVRNVLGEYNTYQFHKKNIWTIPISLATKQEADLFNNWRENKTVLTFYPDYNDNPDEIVLVIIANEGYPFVEQISPIFNKYYVGELELREWIKDDLTVTDTFPDEDATSVMVDVVIRVVFNEYIDEESINSDTFILYEGTTPVTIDDVNVTGNIVSIIPEANLNYDEEHTLVIDKELFSLSENTMVDDYSFSFTTMDNSLFNLWCRFHNASDEIVFVEDDDYIAGDDYDIDATGPTGGIATDTDNYIAGTSSTKIDSNDGTVDVIYSIDSFNFNRKGGFGFWVNFTEDERFLTVVLYESSVSLQLTIEDDDMFIYYNTTLIGSVPNISDYIIFTNWHFVYFEITTNSWKLYIDDIDMTISNKTNRTTFGDFVNALIRSSAHIDDASLNINNFIIAKENVDFKKLKGYSLFDSDRGLTSVTTPLYGIYHWMSFDADTETNLLRYQYYEEKDYCDFPFLLRNNGDCPVPADFVTTSEEAIAGMSGCMQLTSAVGEYTAVQFHNLISERSYSQVRIGFWFKASEIPEPGTFLYLYLLANNSSGQTVSVQGLVITGTSETNLQITALNQSLNVLGTITISSNKDSWYFVEFYVNGTTKAWGITLTDTSHNANSISGTFSSTAPLLQDFIYLGVGNSAQTSDVPIFYIQNLIVSSNYSQSLYTTTHGGTRLCYLTEYPK